MRAGAEEGEGRARIHLLILWSQELLIKNGKGTNQRAREATQKEDGKRASV